MPRKKKEPEVLYTNFISARKQRIKGIDFQHGDRIPIGLIPSNKIAQLESWGRIIDQGHSRMERMRRDGWIRD